MSVKEMAINANQNLTCKNSLKSLMLLLVCMIPNSLFQVKQISTINNQNAPKDQISKCIFCIARVASLNCVLLIGMNCIHTSNQYKILLKEHAYLRFDPVGMFEFFGEGS